MNVIGINFGHDAAISIIKDGKIVFSIEEEKISRIKQDVGWPLLALKEGIRQTGIQPSEVDVIAIGSLLYSELGEKEILFRFTKRKWDKWREYAQRILMYYGLKGNRFSERNKEIFIQCIRAQGFSKARISFFNHHLCHAVSAWYCAPFISDLIITCDGHGDGESFNFYRINEKDGITALKINDYTVSVGAFYSTITEMLGFRPTRHEGKITGLAAYGKPTPLTDQFYELFRLNDRQCIERFPFDQTAEYWSAQGIKKRLSLKDRINLETSEGAIGVDYTKRYIALLEQVKALSRNYSKEDIAFAAQQVAERIVIEETQRIIKNTFGSKKVKVALAGGVFANVRINQKIYELEQVENVFIQPAMGDSGLSLGAAILADIDAAKRPVDTDQYRFSHTYWGPDYSNEVSAFVNNLGNEYLVEAMTDPAQRIAKLLANNLIVGFWQGAMEWGPRALGKRSMILNTFDRKVNDTLNQRLNRTEFMPFAPSVIDFMVEKYMPKYDASCPAGDYMTITYDVSPEYHDLLQAVVHVDGTARPQVVKKETNPYFYKVIEAFYNLTGCGAIVNTSFNVHEEPIVSTPESAFNALRDDRIDVLILDNYLISKKNGAERL